MLRSRRSTTLLPFIRSSFNVPSEQSNIVAKEDDLLDGTSQKLELPVLHWFGNTGHDTGRSKRQHTRSQSHSGTSTPSPPSTPPSPSLSALHEALTECLPRIPPTARLPESSRCLTRPPYFLGNLTRSTLPTSSLSPQRTTTRSAFSTNSSSVDDFSLIILNSPPTRSSIDSLRRLSIQKHSRSRSVYSKSALSDESPPQTRPTSPAGWWWFQPQNKDKVDVLLNEEDRADTLQEERSNLHRKYRTPMNPVVFCHGLLGFDSVTIGPSIAPVEVTHWRGIKEVLEANGVEVLITRVPATSSYVDRAKVLEQRINEVYPGRSVHLIGHSMGGLDCRYLTTHLTSRKFRVLSVTTIATPHRGSSFADHFLSTVGPTRMPSVLSALNLLPNGGGDGKAFECLTVESMQDFNKETPDVEGVKYFSWGAVYDPGIVDTWKWPHSVILKKEGPNDGLVSVESSKWGTYLGTLKDVNHLDLVGWINPMRYKWAEMVGKEIKFRPATFYLDIADMLAGEVEGQPKDEQGTAAASTDNDQASNVNNGPKLTDEEHDDADKPEQAELPDSLASSGAEARNPGSAKADTSRTRPDNDEP